VRSDLPQPNHGIVKRKLKLKVPEGPSRLEDLLGNFKLAGDGSNTSIGRRALVPRKGSLIKAKDRDVYYEILQLGNQVRLGFRLFSSQKRKQDNGIRKGKEYVKAAGP
jgi:hypothetical protein